MVVLHHPLAKNFLSEIRDQRASRATVRHHIRALAVLLFAEATRDLPTETGTVQTPLAETDGAFVRVSVGLVPILRAGLGMVDGILEMLPDAKVYHPEFSATRRRWSPSSTTASSAGTSQWTSPSSSTRCSPLAAARARRSAG